MSFYSYKNANTCTCPGTATGNDILNGLNKRVCIQVKNVYDACLQQEQLSDKKVVVSNIVPVLPAGCGCQNNSAGCKCNCDGNVCTCTCANCNAPLTHEEAVENAAALRQLDLRKLPFFHHQGQHLQPEHRTHVRPAPVRPGEVQRGCAH